MSKATDDVIEERARQMGAEGWTPEHDDLHGRGDLAVAGACYAMHTDAHSDAGDPPPEWPWEPEWWKPKGTRRDLVRAAALIIAEIERIDRS